MKIIIALALAFSAQFAAAANETYDCVSHNDFSRHELLAVDWAAFWLDGQPVEFYDFQNMAGINRADLVFRPIDGITGMYTDELYCKLLP